MRYREVESVGDKVIFEIIREGRTIGYAHGEIDKDTFVQESKYGTLEEARNAAKPKPKPKPAKVPDDDIEVGAGVPGGGD